MGWLKGGYSRLIKVDALKQVSEAPWDKVMQCYLPPLPHPPPPPWGQGASCGHQSGCKGDEVYRGVIYDYYFLQIIILGLCLPDT